KDDQVLEKEIKDALDTLKEGFETGNGTYGDADKFKELCGIIGLRETVCEGAPTVAAVQPEIRDWIHAVGVYYGESPKKIVCYTAPCEYDNLAADEADTDPWFNHPPTDPKNLVHAIRQTSLTAN